MSDYVIRRAGREDAAALASFGAHSFKAAFGASTPAEDMRAYLRDTYSPERQRAEIEESGAEILLAESDGGERTLLGYAYLRPGPPPTALDAARPMEIKRFYVAPSRHGSGLAIRLMEAALESARAAGSDAIWLSAWEHNGRAIRFYERHGFGVIGERPFPVGNDIQRDLVMTRQL